MQTCASCGTTQELRLYELRDDLVEPRRWWCVGCFSWARGLGVEADLVPVWIERAALHRLPAKPTDAIVDRRVAFAGRRASDRQGASRAAWDGRLPASRPREA